MVLLRQEQMRHRIQDGVTLAGNTLVQHKSNYSYNDPKTFHNLITDELEYLRPNTVGQRLTTPAITDIIKKAFHTYELDQVKFEFGIATVTGASVMEKQSKNFVNVYNENSPKDYPVTYPLNSPSGSETENLSPNEILIVVTLNYGSLVFESLWLPIISAIVFTILIMTAFYLTVRTMLRQKKLSEIKNDFINNMTHEFKTPLATISLAVDALRNDKVAQDREKMNYFSSIIKEENKRMNKHVETILQAAVMDRQELTLNKVPLHVHNLIHEIMDNYKLQLEEKGARAELSLDARFDFVEADQVHFRNLISNLVDNAVKYSKDNLLIKIATYNTNKFIGIRIEDNGI